MECSSQGMKHPAIQHWPVEFTSKKCNKHRNLPQPHRKTRLMYTPWPRKITSLPFHPCCKCDYRSQATGSNLQERNGKPIAQASKNTMKNTLVQYMNTIQAWATSVHHRLAVYMQP